MSLDNPKGIESSVSNTQPRRKFLKKASAGALITSLPAHSVWGNTCSVSGAMSGNLSGTGGGGGPVCDQPELFEGRSPGSWKQFFATGAVHSDIQKMHSMFSYVGESWQANGANADSPGGVKAAKRTCVFNDV